LNAQRPAAGPRSGDPAQRVLADLAAAGEDRGARLRVLGDVLQNGGIAGAAVLLQVLSSAGADERRWIVTSLSEAGHRGTLPRLRAAYANEDDPDVRAAIVRAT